MSQSPSVISPNLSNAREQPTLGPPSPTRSHSDARGDASVLPPVASAPSPVLSESHRSGPVQCSREQEHVVGSVAELLPADKLAELLASFSTPEPLQEVANEQSPTQRSVAAHLSVVEQLTAQEIAVIGVDARAKALAPT